MNNRNFTSYQVLRAKDQNDARSYDDGFSLNKYIAFVFGLYGLISLLTYI